MALKAIKGKGLLAMEYRKTDKITLDHKGYGQRAETGELII